ncbi:MAG: cytidine deaminase [Candidatus Cloacimonetes bacterium]|nr:cytidine deaminase [Candidatus Cloacimonadota bacterium]
MDDITIKKLISAAKNASKNSYSPYSNFKVGTALLTKSGKIFQGTNVENASFPAGICAERVAVFGAISKGIKDFEALAIYAEGKKFPFPCGICRQVIAEFCSNLPIIIAKNETDFVIKNISDLLPSVFKFNSKK